MHPDSDRQKQAIANAFRVACLSTHNKSLKSIATQYQDLLHIPYQVDDPHVYTEALELARQRHNAMHSSDPHIHQSHYQSLQDFIRYFQAHNPQLSPSEAREKALREVNVMQYEIEDKYARDHANKVPTEYEVFKLLDRRLKNYGKDHKLATLKREPETDLYPGWQQRSIIGIANTSRNIDELYQYAQDEIKQGGKGHQFRDDVLKQKFPEIGPKEASLAWYLLAPQRSELAIIDDLILDALDHKAKDFYPRDIALAERQLRAGKDASGYNHVPLALFQKGLLDQYQGPSNHQTISAWDPHPVHQADWNQKTIPSQEWPGWWKDTKPYRDQVLEDWNRNEGAQYSPRGFVASYAIRYVNDKHATDRIATVGPNTDQLANDPLANVTDDDPRNPNPPSLLWQSDEICPICNGSQIMEINGKKVACECQGWAAQQQFDPSFPDPALENPEPGVLNPSPEVTGP